MFVRKEGEMMNEQENVQQIHEHFTAFRMGDFSAVVDTIAEDVDWQSTATRSIKKEMLWAKLRHSRQFTAKDNRVIWKERTAER
jgi:ketosteroid isomerase-like protein